VKRINQVFNADTSPGPEGAFTSEGEADGFIADGFEDDPGSFGFGTEDEDEGFGFGDSETGGLDAAGLEAAGFGFETEAEGESLSEGARDAAWDAVPLEDEARDTAPPDRVYTGRELAALLERALGAGRSRDMESADLVWELRRLVNEGGAAYYEIPANPARYGLSTEEDLQGLVSNYLVPLSGSIGPYANHPLEPTAIKTTVQLRTLGEADTERAMGAIHGYIEKNFPEGVEALVGGSALVEKSLNQLVVQSQLISVVISLLAVFLIIALSNKSLIAGLIGVLPLSVSILINFAVMGFLGIKLNIGTSMVASVSVGIGIDYTIHYLEAFKREYLAAGNAAAGTDFLQKTFTTSGKAILINALSVGAGFAVLMLSKFVMLGDLGLLIAITMITSALVSLTVIPVLLLLINPAFIRRPAKGPGAAAGKE
jgi:predicted RND superfamily exporter protein